MVTETTSNYLKLLATLADFDRGNYLKLLATLADFDRGTYFKLLSAIRIRVCFSERCVLASVANVRELPRRSLKYNGDHVFTCPNPRFFIDFSLIFESIENEWKINEKSMIFH